MEPLKRLTSVATKDGLADCWINVPRYIPIKLGLIKVESLSVNFASFAKQLEYIIVFSGTKAAFAERAIRALEAQTVRYLEEKWIWRYIDKLPDFVKTLNDRWIDHFVWHRQRLRKSICSILSHLNKGLQWWKKKGKVQGKRLCTHCFKECALQKGISTTVCKRKFSNFHSVLHSSTL